MHILPDRVYHDQGAPLKDQAAGVPHLAADSVLELQLAVLEAAPDQLLGDPSCAIAASA